MPPSTCTVQRSGSSPLPCNDSHRVTILPSPISPRVRILESASEVRARCAPGSFDFDVRGVVEARIQAAIDTRRAMGLPSADTDVYRLINSGE